MAWPGWWVFPLQRHFRTLQWENPALNNLIQISLREAVWGRPHLLIIGKGLEMASHAREERV